MNIRAVEPTAPIHDSPYAVRAVEKDARADDEQKRRQDEREEDQPTSDLVEVSEEYLHAPGSHHVPDTVKPEVIDASDQLRHLDIEA